MNTRNVRADGSGFRALVTQGETLSRRHDGEKCRIG